MVSDGSMTVRQERGSRHMERESEGGKDGQ